MEIEIQSKINNPLLNRTEVQFIVHHDQEKTPKRELVRTELASQLKVKKENIIVNFMKSSFGLHETVGYAKVYKNVKEAQQAESDHLLKRNQAGKPEKKEKEEEQPTKEPEEKTSEEKPAETPEQPEPPAEPEPTEKQEPEKTETPSAEPEKKEEPSEEKKE